MADQAQRFRGRRGAINAEPDERAAGRGYLASIALAAGIGLLLCSLGNAFSRSMTGPAELTYWAGLLLIALPIFYRLTSRSASPAERFALVCLLGLSLYGVKVVRDAPLFSFSDELVHAFNADQIATHHELFRYNPILPVTPNYFGLEGATTSLMSLTGMSSYGAGIVVVGAARLVLVASLFLLFKRVSGSARTAGIGVAIYVGNFNFLFWGAQYSYESLALPLMALAILAAAEREADGRRRAREWAVPILLATMAIVVTHHLTSYFLAAFLAALALTHWALRRNWKWPNPWRFAVFATALSAGWLLLVASETVGYIAPVLREAFEAIFDTAAGGAPPRALFEARESGIPATPLLPRAVALLAVLILAAGLPFGLLRLWDRYRDRALPILFGLAALGFFATLALRFAPAAWETGNRAASILFIGLAFVLAIVGLERWRPRRWPWLGRAALTACLGTVLVGGTIAGWSWDLQLASPLRAKAEGSTISSPPLALAEWARRHTLPSQRFAANTADARLLMSPGERVALAGKTPDIQDILFEPRFAGWELPLLRENRIRYVVTNRREVSSDATRGYFFAREGPGGRGNLLPKKAITKFGRLPGVARIYADGDIAIYDLGDRP